MAGDIWKYSDRLDDIDIAMLRKDFITYEQGQKYYGMGDKAFIRMAHEAGAVYKIGKAVRVNRKILEAYMRSLEDIPRKGVKYKWETHG